MNLDFRFGADRGLSEAEMNSVIEEALAEHNAERQEIALPPPPANIVETSATKPPTNPQEEFLRMLRLSNLDSFSMSDDQRDTFIDMAENLGLDPGEAEDLCDLYLEDADEKALTAPPAGAPKLEAKTRSTPAATEEKSLPTKTELNPELGRAYTVHRRVSDTADI